MIPWLSRAAPETIAVEADDGALTYGELLARAGAGALELRGAARVAIALPPGLDFAVALHACLLAGVAAVPVDLREPVRRLADAEITIDAPLPRRAASPATTAQPVTPAGPSSPGAGASAPPVGLSSPGAGASRRSSATLSRSRAPSADLSTAALVVHTSGTTGTPRPAVLTLGQVLHNALGARWRSGMTARSAGCARCRSATWAG